MIRATGTSEVVSNVAARMCNEQQLLIREGLTWLRVAVRAAQKVIYYPWQASRCIMFRISLR